MLNEVYCPGATSMSSENVTLNAPCFKDERDSLSQQIIDKIAYLAQVMDARKGWLIPTNCIADLEAQAYQMNQADPAIRKGCKAPYAILERDDTVSEFASASQGCLSCGPFEVKQNVTIYYIDSDPEWELPNPPPPDCVPTTTTTTTDDPPGNDCDGAGG